MGGRWTKFERLTALYADEEGMGGTKEQAQQFPVGLEMILSSDCSDSEQSLPAGAGTVRDHSDLVGAPSGTEDHICKTSGHRVSFCWAYPLRVEGRNT